MKTTVLTIRLPVDVKKFFRESCEHTGMSMSGVLIALIDGWTPNVRNPGERAVPADEIRKILNSAKKRK